MHVGGYEVNPCFWDEVEKKFAFGLFELDWDVFGVHIEGAVNRYTVNHAGACMIFFLAKKYRISLIGIRGKLMPCLVQIF